MSLEPIVCHVDVACSPDHAFRVFTDKMTLWWPLKGGYSCAGERARGVHVDGREGGLVIERDADGKTYPWGTVTRWDPPRAFAMTWHPGLPEEQSTAVAVSFAAHEAGTRVTVEHSGWEARDEATRAQYVPGWDHVLGLYAASAGLANAG